MAASVPEVEIAHHADPHGAGRPDGEIHALHTLDGHGMSAHLFINSVVDAGREFLQLLVRVLGRKGVRVMDLLGNAVVVGHDQRVGRHALARDQSRVKSCLIRQLHGELAACAGDLHRDGLRRRNQCLNQQTLIRQMGTQKPVGIASFRIHQFLNPSPIHQII